MIRSFSAPEFVRDEAGVVTHVLRNEHGGVGRYKATAPPRPAVELELSVLARYEGTYAWDRYPGREDRTEADVYILEVSVDEKGLIWFHRDDQPRMQAIAVSDNEFRTIGYYWFWRFETDLTTGDIDRVIFDIGGLELLFDRLE